MELPDDPGPTGEPTGELTDKALDTVATMLDAGILDPETGGLSAVRFLAQLEWRVGNGPQRMSEAEAQAVYDFGLYVILGRKVWSSDSVGAGIKIADQEHHWAPVPECDPWYDQLEDTVIARAVVEYPTPFWEAMQAEYAERPPIRGE